MTVLIDRSVPCAMRDGTTLRVNVFRPSEEGRYPVLVFRTPYNMNAPSILAMALDPIRMAEAGYAVVQQDTRGRGQSEGVHRPWVDEYDDGYDTIEWAAKQPWSNGAVGAYGISYHGLTAWASAVAGAPSLRAIAVAQSPNDHFESLFRDGVLTLGLHLHWTVRLMGLTELLRNHAGLSPDALRRRLEQFLDETDDFEALTRTLPARDAFGAPEGHYFPYAVERFEHPTPDEWHAARSVAGRHSSVTTPALITAGWHDVLLQADLQHYSAMRAHGGSREAREETRLVIGPWTHGPGMHLSTAGDVDFGVRASALSMNLREDLTGYHRRWFDHWLKGAPELDFAPVRLFVMGENRWRDEAEWPLARAVPTAWRLQSDGGLSTAPQAADAAPVTYRNDPADPCPTTGGATLLPTHIPKGPVPQEPILARPDVVAFTSEALTEPMEVTGFVRASIWASTSAKDADWIVKLCDVHPDGRTFNVCDGVVRASRRDLTSATPQPLTPGEIVQYDVDLVATSMVFLPGHRLRVIVTSSDFPRYDRNPGTGETSYDAVTFESAEHRIYCDAAHPSHLLLPVVPAA